MKKTLAFTLAEVLITLGIIGIVAAMTIPTLVKSYQEKVTVTKVKRMYSVLSQAVKFATIENGDVNEWDFGDGYTNQTVTAFWSYIKPYIKSAKDCGDSPKCYCNCVVKILDGSDWTNYNNRNEYYKLLLNDGGVLWLRTGAGQKCKNTEGGVDNLCAYLWYDVDGVKGPNTVGRDIFTFIITPNGALPNQGNTCETTGWSCSRHIIEHNNMDYLK